MGQPMAYLKLTKMAMFRTQKCDEYFYNGFNWPLSSTGSGEIKICQGVGDEGHAKFATLCKRLSSSVTWPITKIFKIQSMMGFQFTLPILLIDHHLGNITHDLTHKPSQVSDWLICLFLIGQLKNLFKVAPVGSRSLFRWCLQRIWIIFF